MDICVNKVNYEDIRLSYDDFLHESSISFVVQQNQMHLATSSDSGLKEELLFLLTAQFRHLFSAIFLILKVNICFYTV